MSNVELQVVSTWLRHPSHFENSLGLFEPNHFSADYKAIVLAMLNSYYTNGGFTYQTLLDELSKVGKTDTLQVIGTGEEFALDNLEALRVSLAHLSKNARYQALYLGLERQMEVVRAFEKDGSAPEHAWQEAISNLANVLRDKGGRLTPDPESVLAEFRQYNTTQAKSDFTWGLGRDFDANAPLLLRGGIYMVVAHPKVGKTRYCIQAAWHMLEAGNRLLYFSTEVTPMETQALFAEYESKGKFRADKLLAGDYAKSNADVQAYNDALMQKFYHLQVSKKLAIVNAMGATFHEMAQAAHWFQPDVIVLDGFNRIGLSFSNSRDIYDDLRLALFQFKLLALGLRTVAGGALEKPALFLTNNHLTSNYRADDITVAPSALDTSEGQAIPRSVDCLVALTRLIKGNERHKACFHVLNTRRGDLLQDRFDLRMNRNGFFEYQED